MNCTRDYCTGIMVRRKNKNTGEEFWGCSRYPHCQNTINIDRKETDGIEDAVDDLKRREK